MAQTIEQLRNILNEFPEELENLWHDLPEDEAYRIDRAYQLKQLEVTLRLPFNEKMKYEGTEVEMRRNAMTNQLVPVKIPIDKELTLPEKIRLQRLAVASIYYDLIGTEAEEPALNLIHQYPIPYSKHR